MSLTIRPLTPVFGAEIQGVDLAAGVDDASFAEIDRAFEDYSILLFRNQALDDEAQVAFGHRFGDLEKTHAHVANGHRNSFISEISNLDPEGKLMTAEDPRVKFRIGQRRWHSDSSFKSPPAKASLLHARILPEDGGRTEFASLRAAYDALSDADKAKYEGMVAVHHYTYSRRGTDLEISRPEEDKKFPPVRQPMVRVNPVNGRKALFVGAHAGMIEGMDEEEGRALLDELLDFATQPDFTYSHSWEVGDLIVYDNRSALHRATPYAITEAARVLHKVTVAGVPQGA